jgi:hypothetical protein
MEVATLTDEREYEELRIEMLNLKRAFLNDIPASDMKTLTTTFILNVKQIHDKYLTFLQNYLINESEFSDFLNNVKNVMNL